MSRPVRHIELIHVTNGKHFAAIPSRDLEVSSVPLGWRGIIVELHRLEPRELPEHYLVGYGLSVSTGSRPIRFGWRGKKGWRDSTLNPGECHLLTHGDHNTPRWLDTFDGVSMLLDRRFVAALVRDGLPADNVEFATQRSIFDATIARYTHAFRSELMANAPNGPLYAETLTIGFALHLLDAYAIAKPKLPVPRGKLTSLQLRTVVDFIQGQLDKNLSLVALAEQAHVSPFHFARQFRETVGVPPHQFVLRQRVQKSLGLIKSAEYSLVQIALECGFCDQAHFTRAFRSVIGTTPARYTARV